MLKFLPSIDRYIFRLVIVPMLSVFAIAASLLVLDKMLRLFDFVAVEGGPVGVVFTMLIALVPEYASLGVAAREEQGADNSELAGELAAIWRASIGSRLHEGEQAIPLNALFQWQPDDMPFIHPWVEHYGLVPWLEATLKAVILPVWHMLAAHGVGLEAHAQNSLLEKATRAEGRALCMAVR